MLRRFFLAASLATAVGLCAQSQPGSMFQNQPSAVTQANSPSVVMVPANPYVYVVGGGSYGTGLYLTNPGTLPVQNTGISLAGRAGISLETPLQTGAVSFQPSVILGSPIYGVAPAVATGGYGAPEAATAESGRLINDLGPSYYGNEAAVASAPPPPSLGEVAAHYKSQPKKNVRTFTNADAHRLASTIKIPGTPPTPTVP
ncbi:MAG TPA: hypothetical protein VI488_17625 [Candidatus Angelobacter sp.]